MTCRLTIETFARIRIFLDAMKHRIAESKDKFDIRKRHLYQAKPHGGESAWDLAEADAEGKCV